MKRVFPAVCAAVMVILAVSPTVASGEGQIRVLLTISDPELSAELASRFGVIHDFGDAGFTTLLTPTMAQILERNPLVQVERVTHFTLSKPPGACDPWPECNKDGEENGRPIPDDQTPWGVELVYGDETINGTSGGAGVDVAVLDTGVKKDHPDLARRVEQCVDFTGGKPGDENIEVGKCADKDGHGTHVAGTVLADAGEDGKGIWGVAPEADLFAYKVCGGQCWSDDIATAIRYAADHGAEIISMSLGGDSQSSLIRDAIEYAVQKGCLVVAAAGNDGPSEGSIDYPGANLNVVAVGAIAEDETVWYYSSRGVNDGDYLLEEREVEFGAPGVDIESTWKDGGYAYKTGTSMSTPHITGLAAKLWQGNAEDTRTYLQDLATEHDLSDPGDDSATGFGLPQVSNIG